MNLSEHKERYEKWHGLLNQKTEEETLRIAHSLVGILQGISELPNIDDVVKDVVVKQVEEVLETND